MTKIINTQSNWHIKTLRDICEKVNVVKRSEQNPENDFLYLDIGGINNIENKIQTHKHFKWKEAPSRAQQIVFRNDILFSTVRTYMKNIALIENRIYDGQIASSGFCVIRPNKECVLPKFLFYYSIAEQFLRPLNELQTGSSYPAVRDKDVFNQIIHLPSLSEQQTIVSKIEELFSELDKGIEQLNTAQQQLKIYRQSLLKAAFEGKLTQNWRDIQLVSLSKEQLLHSIEVGRNKFYVQQLLEWENEIKFWEEHGKQGKKPTKPSKLTVPDLPNADHLNRKWTIPAEWTWTQLGTICFVTKLAGFEYTDYVKYDEKGDLYVIKAENAGANGFKNTAFSKIKSESVAMLKRSFLEGGELLITFVGAGTGSVAIVPKDKKYFLGPNIGMARPYIEINTKFYEYLLQSTVGKSMLMATMKAVAQPSLSMGTIRQTPIVFPSLNEQNLIVQEIESRLSIAERMEETIIQKLQQAEALRQSILKQAFEGKLVTVKEQRQEAKVISLYKPKNEYFYQLQVLGLIAKASKQNKVSHGEMTLAKYAYLTDKLFDIPTFYDYQRWHLGPFPPIIKKVFNNKQYFKKVSGELEILNEKKLFKAPNPYQQQIENAVTELTSIFSKYEGKERFHKTELLATVCKVVEDIQTVDLKAVRSSMADWKIELKGEKNKTKAEKFTEAETKKCLEFLKEKGWDKKLLIV